MTSHKLQLGWLGTLGVALGLASACSSSEEPGTTPQDPSGGTGNPAGGNPGQAGTVASGGSTAGTPGQAGTDNTGGTPPAMAGTGGAGNTAGSAGTDPIGGSGGAAGGAPPQIGCTPQGDTPTLSATQIVGGLNRPVELVGLPDETNVLWVIEHRGGGSPSTGTVRAVTVEGDNGTLMPEPVISIQVNSRGNDEEGLHSIALHPNFVQNQLFYIFFSAPNSSDGVVDEYMKTGTSSAMRVRNLYTNDESAAQYHNGGQIDFKPGDADNLYISFGDNQSEGNAQNDGSPNGKILRISLASGDATQIHKGLRNPWRFSFDDQTGDLYVADVGPSGNSSEYLFFGASDAMGLNFGWPGGRPGNLTLHNEFNAGQPIIGGFVYRGNKPGLEGFCGRYIFGSYGNNGQFTSLRVENGNATDTVEHDELSTGDLTAFGQDAAGNLYFVDYGDGTIFRIDPG